jgi:hypothetical protein
LFVALNAIALTTLANFKEALRVPAATDATNDPIYERFINRATDAIESKTGRKLKARRYNNAGSTHPTTTVADEDYLYFSGYTLDKGGDTIRDENGYGVLHLPQWPVQANSVLTFVLAPLSSRDSDGEEWDSADLVENEDYILDRTNGILRLLNGSFSPGYRNYRITCAAGYQTGAAQPYVPGDLEELCIEMAKKLLRGEAGVTSEKLGTWAKTYDPAKANEFIDATIALYRRY